MRTAIRLMLQGLVEKFTMSKTKEWRFIRSCGNGTIVERDGQRGYAKMQDIGREKLSSVLGNLLGLPVPDAEITTVNTFRVVVSVYPTLQSESLRDKDVFARPPFTEDEKLALKAASCLLPFLAWIAATDHNDDTNLIIDKSSNRISAIDFGDTLDFRQNADSIIVPKLPGVVANLDRQLVANTIKAIGALTDEQITAACKSSELSTGEAETIATALQRRRQALHDKFAKLGFLP